MELIHNIALLVALSAAHSVILARVKQGSAVSHILVGLLFGGAGVIGMMTPLHLQPGIIFDGRSVILSVAGLFGGPAAAVIAAGMCAFYRLSLGGNGAWVGVSVILESAALGVIFYYLRKKKGLPLNLPVLFGLGFAVHALMLIFMFALPDNAGFVVLQQVGIQIIILFPAATVLVCLMFLDTEDQLRDRKALQESEKALQKSEEFQRALIACSPLALISLDLDGKVISWNLAAEKIMGWSAGEVIGKPMPCIQPDHESKFASLCKRVMEDGGFSGQEVVRWKKNGKSFTASMSAAPIHDRKGTIQGIMTTLEDITDRKLAQEALAQSEDRFRNIVEGAPDAIFIQNDKKFAYLNRKALTLLGAKEVSDLLGKPVIERFHPDFHQAVQQRIRMLNDRRQSAPPLEQIYLRLDGSQVWVETTGQPVTYEGKSGALVFVRDISERKLAENIIDSQLSELRRWHSAMLGREKRVLQLKWEINALLRRLGEPARYETVEPSHVSVSDAEKPE